MTLEEVLKDEQILTRRNDILELLEEYGNVSEELYDKVTSESNTEVLKAMLKAAAKADSLKQFEELISHL